ncbi:MAG TPA: hypothetical protein VGL19_01025 [Polyangiaceae bacterium]|jgi:hypothetical protein
MSAIVTLVIYLSAADAADPVTPVLVRSAQEILGSQAQVELRTSSTELADSALSSIEPDADAVASIAWLNREHGRASVRCYVGRLHRLVKREVSFDEDAEPKERERMLGFVVGSLLAPDTELEQPADATEPPVVDQPEVKQKAKAKSKTKSKSKPAAESDSSTDSNMESDSDSEVIERPIREAPRHQERFVGMAELVGLAASGVSGSASGFGAALAGRWLFATSLSLRVAAGLRRGDIAAASASSEVEFLGVGLGFELPVSATSPFSLGGRAGALVLRHELDHLSSDDTQPDRKSRILPGADALFEGSWHFSSSAGLVLGAGAELALGHTDVIIKGKEVTDIPPLRGLVELGIQARF